MTLWFGSIYLFYYRDSPGRVADTVKPKLRFHGTEVYICTQVHSCIYATDSLLLLITSNPTHAPLN